MVAVKKYKFTKGTTEMNQESVEPRNILLGKENTSIYKIIVKDGKGYLNKFSGTDTDAHTNSGSESSSEVVNLFLTPKLPGRAECLAFIRDCVNEAADEYDMALENREFIAETLTILFELTIENGQISNTVWNRVVRNIWRLTSERTEMLSEILRKLPHVEQAYPHFSKYMSDKEQWKDIIVIPCLLMLQAHVLSDLPEEELFRITDSKDLWQWTEQRMQAVFCLELLDSYMDGVMKDESSETSNELVVSRCRTFLEEWTPEKIFEYLDAYISGQDSAKYEFSYMCFEHVARIAHLDMNIRKSNYVMYGPTGCGKTELARIVKNILPVPVEIIDASTITSNGFRGNDKEDILFDLVSQDSDLEYGIIIMDEFDKLCLPFFDGHGTNVHRGVQGELLKMIEGITLYRYGRYYTTEMSTENITFVCAGSFDGAFRQNVHKGVGFGSKDEDRNASKSLTECLEEYGMIPELAGRICAVIALEPLEEEELYDILVNKKNNCIENIQKLYKVAYNSEVDFSEDALRAVSSIAASSGLGARGLSGIVEQACHQGRRRLKSRNGKTLQITRDMVENSNKAGRPA